MSRSSHMPSLMPTQSYVAGKLSRGAGAVATSQRAMQCLGRFGSAAVEGGIVLGLDTANPAWRVLTGSTRPGRRRLSQISVAPAGQGQRSVAAFRKLAARARSRLAGREVPPRASRVSGSVDRRDLPLSFGVRLRPSLFMQLLLSPYSGESLSNISLNTWGIAERTVKDGFHAGSLLKSTRHRLIPLQAKRNTIEGTTVRRMPTPPSPDGKITQYTAPGPRLLSLKLDSLVAIPRDACRFCLTRGDSQHRPPTLNR